MEGSQNSEQVTENRFRENMTAEEYTKALQRLTEFSQKELGDISSLEDIARETEGIGSALCAIAYTKGELTPQKAYHFHPGFKDGEPEPGVEKSVFLSAIGGTSVLDPEGGKAEQFALVTIKPVPLDSPPTQGNYEIMVPITPITELPEGEFDNRVYGVEFDGERWKHYLPRKQVNDPEALKTYTRLVQQGVREILATNPGPPAEVPATFMQ